MATDKRCPRCEEVKARDEFHRDRRQPDGLRSCCKVCARESARRYAQRWREEHRDRHRQATSEYFAEHPEKRREYAKRSYLKHRETRYRSDQEWKRANPEKVKAQSKRYSERYPEKIREKTARRRALKRATAAVRVDYNAIWLRDGGICHLCGGAVERDAVHFDHVVPLSKGGAHIDENIRVSHPSCNLRKGAKLLVSAA